MKRRGNGEGTISQCKDGRWCARLTLSGGKRKALYGRTRQEVERKLLLARADVVKGRAAVPEKQTVATYLNFWLGNVVKGTVVDSTYRSYAGHVRNHITPVIGSIRLARLTTQDVLRVQSKMRENGKEPATICRVRATIHRALHDALKLGLVGQNVADLVAPPKVTRHEAEYMTPEDLAVLFNHLKGDPLEALYGLAVATGMRQGEILALRWQDVDLEGGRITVRHTLRRGGGKYDLGEPKSRESRRVIDLPSQTCAQLRQHRERQSGERRKTGGDWLDEDFVFTTKNGTPLDGINVTRYFYRHLAEAGLAKRTFHSLRHTCAALLLNEGMTLDDLKRTLGHARISMTADTYGHMLPTRRRHVAEAMNDALLAIG